ncbi:MAG: DUF2461 domain-containing protein [Acidimicrobiales bacterium]
MAFSGLSPAGIEFYEELEDDNTKAFWTANKHRYESEVKAPMTALCEELSDYGPFRLFRPYNDVRFAKGKPLYKTAQGAYTEGEGGAGYYVHFSAEGFMAGAGYYAMAKDQLARFREAVDDDARGAEIAAIVEQLAKRYDIAAIDELKTAPRGYPKDHPRIELLRRKGLIASKAFGTPKWIFTKQIVTRVRQAWDDMAPMNDWLDTHVGPSELEPMGFGGR